MSTKSVQSVKSNGQSENWMNRMQDRNREAQAKLRKTGVYLQGEPGETVRCICLDSLPTEGTTKNGAPTENVQVRRIDNGLEQTLSIFVSIKDIVDQFAIIGINHAGDLEGVILDCGFGPGKTGPILTSIKEVPQ